MKPVLLVGCGTMGNALFDGWVRDELKLNDVLIVEKNADHARHLADYHQVEVVTRTEDLPADFRPATVVLAVKPQDMDEALAGLGRFVGPDTCFLSIAAGKSIRYFRDRLGEEARIVRAMPNTPARIHKGVSALCAGDNVSAAQREACDRLLETVGMVVWVEDEELMHAITAVSGGGPAYVFLLVECMAQAGEAAGLPDYLAMRIARATVAGAAGLLDTDETAADLRKQVASPKGTTERALAVLMAERGMASLFVEAIAAATERSRELAG